MASNDLSYLEWPKCIQIQNQSSQQLHVTSTCDMKKRKTWNKVYDTGTQLHFVFFRKVCNERR